MPAALTQLLEYRFLYRSDSDQLCAVFNRPIADRRLALLEALGIAVVRLDDKERACTWATCSIIVSRLSYSVLLARHELTGLCVGDVVVAHAEDMLIAKALEESGASRYVGQLLNRGSNQSLAALDRVGDSWPKLPSRVATFNKWRKLRKS